MKQRKVKLIPLSLETLEDRTLLAGAFDEAAYLHSFDASDGVEFSLTPKDLDHLDDEFARWVGDGTSEITVYLDRLPDEIGTLTFVGFSEARVIGEREVSQISANSVGSLLVDVGFSAEGSAYDGAVYATDVDHLAFNEETPAFISLAGDRIDLDLREGFEEPNSLFLVRANYLEIEIAERSSESLEGWRLFQLGNKDGNPLALALVNVEPTYFSLVGDIVSADEGTELDSITSGIDLQERVERALQALDSLAQNEALPEDVDLEGLRSALIQLGNGTEDGSDFGLVQMQLLNALDGVSIVSPVIEGFDAGNNLDGARLAESDLEVETVNSGLELRETETGLKVFILSDESSTDKADAGASSLRSPQIAAPALDANAEDGEAHDRNELMPHTLGALDALVAILSRTQSAGEALRTHFLNKVSDEVTPGGQVGLLVDGSWGPNRKDFIQRGF